MVNKTEVADYIMYKLGQVYAARGTILWLLGLVAAIAVEAVVFAPGWGGLLPAVYVVASVIRGVVVDDYRNWKQREAEP